jgi:cellulose synthase/poly-beta-1,6-N-acetylglucosamine synthase-like glycosyltransferase
MMFQLFIIMVSVFGGLLLAVLLAYSPRIVAWFGALLPYPHLKNPVTNKIAVIIPARNESETITPLLNSLLRQSYKDFEVFIIVKDPADPTIQLARSNQFHVRVEKGQSSKADALDGVLHSLILKDPNAFGGYLILDADAMIRDDYLEEMNNAMASGRQVIVSKKIVKNFTMGRGALSVQGAANGYIWTLFDDMGNRFKSLHHIALFTVGSGLLISKDIIISGQGWPYKTTLTEDCELAADIIANHWSTYYAPYAPIFMEEAPTLSMTNKRRTRWMTGLTDSQRLYQQKDFSLGAFWDIYFSFSIFLTYLFFGILILSSLCFLTMGVLLFFINDSVFALFILAGISSLALIYLTFFVMALFTFFVQLHDVKGHLWFKIVTLFAVPFHYIGYFPIMAKVFLGKSSSKWEEIARVKRKEAR